MGDWDLKWQKILKETPNLVFNPDWSLVFKDSPYTMQVRASLRKEFYKKRSEEVRKRLLKN
jgi:hypothetical protein